MKKALIIIGCLVVLLTSCDDPTPTYTEDVYVSGYENDGHISYVAKYWKNGVATTLLDGTTYNAAGAIQVVGNDVYVLATNTNEVKYWKNGQCIHLTDGQHTSYGLALFVSGNDVYVAGTELSDAGIEVAKYWKNGVVNILADSSLGTRATAITVVGNDVYVAGLQRADGEYFPRYWKNGVNIPLPHDSNFIAGASAITAAGNDIYIAGYGYTDVIGYAQYWKNGGEPIILSDSERDLAAAIDIAVAGSDVYVVDQWEGKYWKNGTPITISKNAGLTAITVAFNNVYIAGSEPGAVVDKYYGPKHVARYWKNGVPVTLTDGNIHSVANDIFVVRTPNYVRNNKE